MFFFFAFRLFFHSINLRLKMKESPILNFYYISNTIILFSRRCRCLAHMFGPPFRLGKYRYLVLVAHFPVIFFFLGAESSCERFSFVA